MPHEPRPTPTPTGLLSADTSQPIEEPTACRRYAVRAGIHVISNYVPVPMQRLMWINPGTTVELNGRTIDARRPPSFDAPETTAFFDRYSATLFSADSFGALLQAPVADAGEVETRDLDEGMARLTG